MIVIIDSNQIAQLKMAGGGSGFARDTLHGTTITKEDICVVVGEFVTWLVKNTSGVSLRNCKTDCVGEALSERASGDLNTRGIMGFGMARSDAVDLLCWD